MNPVMIFLPVVVLALHTLLILGLLGRRRVRAAKAGRIRVDYYKLYSGEPEPDDLRAVSRNVSNLLEFPVLFYIAALIVFLLQRVDTIYLVLAWAYVALRVLHSIIHVTYNKVVHRFRAFILSFLVLVGLWVRLGFQLLTG